MKRYAIALLCVVSLAGVACGGSDGGDDGVGSPTSPTAGGGSGGGSCSRPAAPANFAAATSLNSVAFTWSAVGGANDYLVMVGPNPGTSTSLSTNTSQVSYQWNGIQRGTYYARVEARNSCGSSGSSNEISFTIVG